MFATYVVRTLISCCARRVKCCRFARSVDEEPGLVYLPMVVAIGGPDTDAELVARALPQND